MKCFLCKGDTVKSTTTYMTAYKNCYIIIKMFHAKNVHSVVKSLLMAPQCKNRVHYIKTKIHATRNNCN